MHLVIFVALFSLFSTAATAQMNIPAPDDVKAAPADAAKTSSGLAHKVVKAGQGATKPTPADIVMVNYTTWTPDGKMHDTSYGKGPQFLPVGKLIPAWIEGLQLMVAGETRRFWAPEAIAYRGRDPKGPIVFEIELLSIQPNSTPATSK